MDETVIEKCSDNKYHPENVRQIRTLINKALRNELQLNLEEVDIAKLDSLDCLFEYCEKIFLQKINIQAISKWDVSRIRSMKRLFHSCDGFDGKPIEGWNVANVTDLEQTFADCSEFNADLSLWKPLSLKKMSCCFKNCHCFEGRGLQCWTLHKVTSLKEAFKSCKCFNADVGNFGLEKCSDLSSAFEGCLNFEGIGIERWNCRKLRKLNSTFKDCYVFNPDLSRLDVRNADDFSECFFNCFSFEGRGLSEWHDIAAVSFKSMFENAFSFNADLRNWCFKASEADFSDMFNYCFAFEGKGLSAWNIPPKADLSHMLYQCQSIHDEDLSNFYGSKERRIEGLFSCAGPAALGEWLRDFKVHGVESLSELFCNTNITGEYLEDWNVETVTDFSSLFSHCMMLDDRFLKKWNVSGAVNLYKTFNHSSATSEGLSRWDTSNVDCLCKTFRGCRNFTSKGLINWNVEKVTDMNYCFTGSALNDLYLKNWKTAPLQSLSHTFQNCNGNRKDNHGVTGEGLEGFDFSKVSYGECAFAQCRKLKSFYLRKHRFENLYDATLMFCECTSLTGEGFEQLTLSNLEYGPLMFYGCTSLQSRFLNNLTLENLKDGQGFFCGCASLTGEGFHKLRLSRLKDMRFFFWNCTSLNSSYLKSLYLPKVETLCGTFGNCPGVCDEDFRDYNLPSLIQMPATFYNCPNVTGQGVLNWNLIKVTDMDRTFACCGGVSEKTAEKLVRKLSAECCIKSMFQGCCKLKKGAALPQSVFKKTSKIKPITRKRLDFYCDNAGGLIMLFCR